MRVEDSPFRPYWWGVGLADAGVDARPDVGTYGRYEFEYLPPVPFELRGDLDWLAARPKQDEWAIATDCTDELSALLSTCDSLGLSLPTAFTTFMSSHSLPQRIRSCTACFLDLGAVPVAVPATGGHVIRFLADQQGCLFWYLYLSAGASDHAVVSSDEYYGEDADEVADAEQLAYCGESFEAFLCRYWLENEIWFANNDGTPMPDVGAEYVQRYRQTVAD